MTPAQLHRIRWAVRAVLALGIVASVAANVLHAEPNGIAQTIAAWPPLALLLTVELISRVPVHRRWLAGIRMLATGAIAGIAAWVSYWHMAGVAARYGEEPGAAHLIPLSVDGLVVVASVCLVELGGRLATAAAEVEPVPLPLVDPVPVLVEPDPPADPLPEATPEVRPALATTEGATKSVPPVRISEPPNSARRVPNPAARRNPELTRRLVVAAAMDGMKPAEIAESLGLTVRRVNQLLRPVPVSRNP